MSVELEKHQIEAVIPSIKRYISEEFGEDIGDLKAQLLLNYFLKEIAPYAYNQGVKDAENYFRIKMEDLPGSCFEFELTYWDEKRKAASKRKK